MRVCHLHCPVERTGQHSRQCDRLNRRTPTDVCNVGI